MRTRFAGFEDRWVGRVAPEDRWRARAAVRFALAVAPWGLLFCVVFAALGLPTLAASLGIAGLGVGATPVVVRSRGVALAGHWMVAFLLQSLLVSAWWLDGLFAACFPWIGLCVVAATLLSGRVAGLVWTGIAGLCVVGMLVAHVTGAIPPPVVADEVRFWLAASAHGSLFVVVLAMVVAAMDVNERSRAELERARIAAEQANHAKSDFLARMSHELRTPLNAVIGYSELIAEDATEPVRQDVDRIRDAGHHLLTVVNDVLDLAKVESGRMEFRAESVDLRVLVPSVLDAAAPLSRARGNAVAHAVEGEGRAVADELRLRQCLLNLVANAAKFTASGEIRVLVRDVGDRVAVEVHDNGIGMTEAQLSRVFEPFAQGTDDTGRTHGGTGLGLAIVRQFVDRMGGGVEARSTPGVGSVFVLHLPRS